MEVVKNAAQFFELTLLLCSGAGIFKLVGELSDLFLCIFAAADQFARDPAARAKPHRLELTFWSERAIGQATLSVSQDPSKKTTFALPLSLEFSSRS